MCREPFQTKQAVYKSFLNKQNNTLITGLIL
jgi:hypothetical protein